jgi:hypothetical protein
MAAAWPALQDVKNVLRLGTDTSDDAVVSANLAAAIQWVANQCMAAYVTPGTAQFLPDSLFTAAQYEAARLYRRRDSVDGTIGWGDLGVVRVGPKDPDIATLMAAYLNVVV